MNSLVGEPLTIVHTVWSLERRLGGISNLVPKLADAMFEYGCTASVISCDNVDGRHALVLPERATFLRAPTLRLGRRSLWSPQFSTMIEASFTPLKSRVLHDHGLWTYQNFLAARFAARKGIPLIVSSHGMLEPWALEAKGFRKRIALSLFQRRILDSATVIMVTAESELHSVRRAGLRQPVAIVPIGISLPSTVARHDVQTNLRTMLFLSRIHPKKGLLAFVEAWHRVNPSGWRVIIAGPDEGGHLAQVRRAVECAGLQSQFQFQGETDGQSKSALFESADVFVLPTYSENFGVVVAEAMAYGVPVLTTYGAPWSVLTTINAGWWVKPGVEGLVTGLRSVLATTVMQRAAMGKSGREYVAKHLTWGKTAEMAYHTYVWALGRQRELPHHMHA